MAVYFCLLPTADETYAWVPGTERFIAIKSPKGITGSVHFCEFLVTSPETQDIGEWMGVSTVEAGRQALERGEFLQAVWEATSIKDPP